VKVRITPAARADLEAIDAFIRRDNPDAAQRVTEALRARIELLERYPNLGRPGKLPGTRELVIARLPYLVIYRLHASSVEILRVMHTSQRR
jgi:addiction module RelE/StbE family toxin